MNKRRPQKLIGFILSFTMVFAGVPDVLWTAYAETTLNNDAEGSAAAEASASNIEERSIEAEDADNTDYEEDSTVDAEPAEEVSDDVESIEEESTPVVAGAAVSVALDEEIENGTVTFTSDDAGVITGIATPSEGFDLATVRILYSNDGDEQEEYIDYSENNENEYSFNYDTAGINGTDLKITATFINTRVWDGGVDVSWYDPNKKSFDIYNPAQLAGVAAIVNGMVDENETREDQIKDHDRYVDSEGNIAHKHIQTRREKTRLLEQTGGGIEDEVYRLPEARTTGIFAEDDLYDDMRYREIHLRADINMGSDNNYTCIGGKHAMNVKNDKDADSDPKVIDTRFQGLFDGHGHTVTINCNRYSHKGFGYAWNVGLIGYLGGAVDREESNAKDNIIYYAKENHPTVRNVVVRGSVLGRRCTGGVVGRIGETNYSCIVENCANYATVMATDMRGCAGVVGAAWGKSVIRNCYNAGKIAAIYDEIGGIVGSNGYNRSGADIYNCFNVGEIVRAYVTESAVSDERPAGSEIGTDGDGNAPYTVGNCYFINGTYSGTAVAGYNKSNNGLVSIKNMTSCTESELKSQAVLDSLNSNGNVFVEGGDKNSGYPVLYFEKSDSHPATCSVSIADSDNGTITVDGKSESFSVPYGTVVELSAEADRGYRCDTYTANGETFANGFYTVTSDVSFAGDFKSVETAALTIPDYDNYTVSVTRIYNAQNQEACEEQLETGDTVYRNDIIVVAGHIKNGAVPSDANYEYNGKFENIGAVNSATVSIYNTTGAKLPGGQLRVTGDGDVELVIDASMQKKDWITQADTSWYKGHESDTEYTIHNAQELAGMARLICDGNDMGGTDFAGKTIVLADDIDLTNADGTDGKRLWRTVGNPMDTFRGTFDGNGHTISNMYVSFFTPVYGHVTGSHGGLFGVTKGATIKNLTITGLFATTSGDTGAFVGNAIDTVVENCTANVTMQSVRETGGIVGKAEGVTTIRNCKMEGSMAGTYEIGGIVGSIAKNESLGKNAVTIENCVNNADISSTYQYVGGIVSKVQAPATISECVNNGNLSAKPTANPDTNDTSVGGIAGTVSSTLDVESCVNTGAVTGSSKIGYVAGIVGYENINSNTGSIMNSYNVGDVSGGYDTRTGGITNVNDVNKNAYLTVENCYNAGAMKQSTSVSAKGIAGGILGAGKTTQFKNVYYTDAATANVKARLNEFGTMLTEEELKSTAAALGEAYVPDANSKNNGFPILAWQDPSVDVSVDTVVISSLKASGTTAAVISWNALEGAESYEIYRAKTSTGTYSKVGTVAADPELATYTFKNTGLTPGGWYYYKVRASKDVYGGNIYYGDFSSVKNIRLSLAKPTLKSASNVKGKKAKITWTKLSGATGYQIYRSTKKSSGYKKIKTISSGSTVSYTNGSLKKKKTYYYKIRAYSKVNGKTIYSSYSVVKSVKIKK